jgi:hypothetical protein
MSGARRRPSVDERDAFILKLIEFRTQLSPPEQRYLDAMAVAAFCEVPAGDVQGYAQLTAADVRPTAADTPWMSAFDRLPDAVAYHD